jgi:hypothetical protein
VKGLIRLGEARAACRRAGGGRVGDRPGAARAGARATRARAPPLCRAQRSLALRRAPPKPAPPDLGLVPPFPPGTWVSRTTTVRAAPPPTTTCACDSPTPSFTPRPTRPTPLPPLAPPRATLPPSPLPRHALLRHRWGRAVGAPPAGGGAQVGGDATAIAGCAAAASGASQRGAPAGAGGSGGLRGGGAHGRGAGAPLRRTAAGRAGPCAPGLCRLADPPGGLLARPPQSSPTRHPTPHPTLHTPLPKGMVRKKPLAEADIGLVAGLLEAVKPHQIFAAGDLSGGYGGGRGGEVGRASAGVTAGGRAPHQIFAAGDLSGVSRGAVPSPLLLLPNAQQRTAQPRRPRPSPFTLPHPPAPKDPHGTHRTCLAAVLEALRRLQAARAAWLADCRVWLYRGAWQEWGVEAIDMAVPLSPADVRVKRHAILKHQARPGDGVGAGRGAPHFLWPPACMLPPRPQPGPSPTPLRLAAPPPSPRPAVPGARAVSRPRRPRVLAAQRGAQPRDGAAVRPPRPAGAARWAGRVGGAGGGAAAAPQLAGWLHAGAGAPGAPRPWRPETLPNRPPSLGSTPPLPSFDPPPPSLPPTPTPARSTTRWRPSCGCPWRAASRRQTWGCDPLPCRRRPPGLSS